MRSRSLIIMGDSLSLVRATLLKVEMILPCQVFIDSLDRVLIIPCVLGLIIQNKKSNKSLHPTANRFRVYGVVEISHCSEIVLSVWAVG